MKAVKGRNNVLCLISREESRLFNKADFDRFLNISNLNERERHLAEDLHKRNVFRKVRKNEHVGFTIYPQKPQL